MIATIVKKTDETKEINLNGLDLTITPTTLTISKTDIQSGIEFVKYGAKLENIKEITIKL